MNSSKYNYDIIKENWDSEDIEMIPTRNGLGDGLVQIGKDNKDVVAINANLAGSVRHDKFEKEFPNRAIQVGVAEQNMASIGLGLALYGKIPFISSFAAFSPGLNFSQIRLAAISNANLKVASSHYGINIGSDGVTAQMLSDISMMRALAGVRVITPVDYTQAVQAVHSVVNHHGVDYIRFTRSEFPNFLQENSTFEIGKNQVLRYGNDVSIFATGSMVYRSLKVAKRLEEGGIDAEVVNVHTIKPIDRDQIIESVLKTKRAVSVEEHNIHGGLGSAVAEVLSEKAPVPLKIIGVEDEFGQTGEMEELLDHYGLSEDKIYNQIKKFLD